jgi:hypothetical protein
MLTRKALGLASCLCGLLLATAQERTFAAEEDGSASVVAQVNSVSELTDVDPSSWAFQSLKTVVERFGCLEGYPSKAFLGNQSLTRYEFAAGLNACLEKVAEQITAGTTGKATKDDLLILKRLQADFSSELATLRTRVDTLELQTKALENRLFSTTAKLDGSVVMAITGGGASANIRPNDFSTTSFPGNSANTTFVARTSLNVRATLSGADEFLIRLRGVTGQDVANSFAGIAGGQGTLFYAGSTSSNLNGSLSYDGSALTPVSTNGSASVVFDKVRYTTGLFDNKLRIYVGSRIDLFEFIDTNSFANNEEVDFSNGFLIHNTLITNPAFAGAGLGFDWEITPDLNLRGAYIAASGGRVSAFGSGGVTGGNNNIVGELEVRPSPSSSIRLQYSRSVFTGGDARFTDASTGTIIPLGSGGVQGGFFFGLPQTQSDAAGLNAEWAITPDIGIFGRFAFGWSNATATSTSIGNVFIIINGSIASTSFTTATTSTTTYSETNSWSVGLSLPRLFNSLGTLGISVGQVPRASLIFSSDPPFNSRNLPISSGRETDLEIFYRLPIGDRLTITPDLQLIFDPLSIAGNPIITIGTLRAVFSF